VSGVRSQVLAQPLASKAAILIEQETLKKRISNVEGMYSARRELLCRTVHFKKNDEASVSPGRSDPE
jgi:hypothetical protein